MRGMILNNNKKKVQNLKNQISTQNTLFSQRNVPTRKGIHFPLLIVLLILRDEPLLAPLVCNFLCCPHVSSY